MSLLQTYTNVSVTSFDRALVPPTPCPVDRLTWTAQAARVCRKVVHHIKNHVGVGIVCAVAYFDPGNWGVDLEAGSQFGYRPMLFVILMAGLGAIVLQSLAHKLGCVTGLDLATHCRLLLHDHPTHRRLVRFFMLYPLYILCEIAIISTDLAELLGSAIGICLLIPSLPLWAGVLVTSVDVLVFLIIGDPSRRHGRPVKVFELTIMLLVTAVFACFIVLLVRVGPAWNHVFIGFIPDKSLFQQNPDALYTAVGILGATVMPHALFLGSRLATQDRVSAAVELPHPVHASERTGALHTQDKFRLWVKSLFEVSRAERIADSRDYRNKYERENNSLAFVRAHLPHGLVDVIFSLLGVAVPINAAILVIAATVFFHSQGSPSNMPAGLFDAYDIIKTNVGSAAAILFALALLCSGQTASITATFAGQIVSEGFIEWRISPFLRRFVTRLMGLIPSMVVAIAVGRPGINTLLVASQVALSIVLPFVAFPLVWLTSNKSIMRVRKPSSPSQDTVQHSSHPNNDDTADTDGTDVPVDLQEKSVSEIVENTEVSNGMQYNYSVNEDYLDYSNGWPLTIISYTIFLIILAANLYVIVMLGIGHQ